AAAEDLVDAVELGLGPELAGVRLDHAEGPANRLPDREAVSPARREVHHRGLEAVPRREPLVLGREDAVVRRDLLSGLVALAVVLHERLAVRRDRDDVLERRGRIADPDLDRPEARVEP